MPEHTQKTYLLAEKHRISSADGSLRHHGVYPGWQIGEKGCEKMLQEGNKQAPVWCKVFVSALAELSELVRLQREWVVSQKVRERGSPALCGLLQDFLTSGTRQFCIYPRYVYGSLKDVIDSANTTGTPIIEACARTWMQQLVSIVVSLHDEAKVAHRRIQLENVVFADADRSTLHVTGFLDAVETTSRALCEEVPDVPSKFTAPEIVLNRPYTPEWADVWSVGVVAGCLLHAEFPRFQGLGEVVASSVTGCGASEASSSFPSVAVNSVQCDESPMRRRPRALSSATPQVPPHATKDASIKQLWAWASKEDPRPWPLTVSAQALDFVASAVQLRPSRRPTAAALRAHCWLTQGSMPPGPVSLAALAPVPVEKDAVVICPIMWKPLPPGMDDILGDPFDRDADEPLNNNDCVDDEEDGLSSE